MMKAQELAILDKAIVDLGTDSYLGPWLRSVRDCVERDVRSDFIPAYLPIEAYREGGEIIAAAKREAVAIVTTAKDTAKKALDKTYQESVGVRQSAAASLLRMAHELAH
jgi:hypothetical protein